jgi:hypothetical protein
VTCCTFCHTPIQWVRTPTGMPIPLDLDHDPQGHVHVEYSERDAIALVGARGSGSRRVHVCPPVAADA